MLNIGMTELLIFAVIALLILGPDKLPEAVRFVGKWSGKIKRTVSNLQTDLDRELRLSELREQMQAEMKRIQELEAKMQAQMNDLQQPLNLLDQEKVSRAAHSEHFVYQPLEHPVPMVYRQAFMHTKPAVAKQHAYPELKVAV